MKFHFYYLVFLGLVVLVLFFPARGVSQDEGSFGVANAESAKLIELDEEDLNLDVHRRKISDIHIDPTEMTSLFFTANEHAFIKDARLGLTARLPEVNELEEEEGDLESVRDPGLRELSLSGIVYVSGQEWTVWLNGSRVTPDAIPKEVLDLKVHEHFIELEWFDEYTNKIFPVRLRSHQRFNLDTRLFLPG